MDLENKPNMKRIRIGGGYMVVYGSGDGIWQRWWYMAAVMVYGSRGRMVRQRREKL